MSVKVKRMRDQLDRNNLLEQNQRLIDALTLITEMDGDQPKNP